MPLSQKSVQTRYLNDLDAAFLDSKFKLFTTYFGNPDIQNNIRNAKEEQFQEGFLRELFVNILGYTLNPEPDYNLTTEFKNVTGSKKADSAILKNDHTIAAIELKSTTTADLDAVESQALGYKNHHPKCVYVIASNFEKIRFYIQDAVVRQTKPQQRELLTRQGKEIERFFQTCKNEAVRKQSYLSLQDLIQQIDEYIRMYKYIRLHSSLGYITLHDMLLGRQAVIFNERREKLKQAQENRKRQRTKQIDFSKPAKIFTRSEEQSQGRTRALCG
ncbi:hypothetical protein EH223_12740 [candidate division KSB1 bacterium]|nr:transposase [candidate division KSB1 bacterium]RQW02352.1 MAG: hypothetical protein EH223_12740 [candidate division KSB1 bacterium]